MEVVRPQDLKVGEVYNLIYAGPNHNYGWNNGRRTICVVSRTGDDEVCYVQLHGQFGYATKPDLAGGVCTAKINWAFKDDVIVKPESEDGWYRHSVRVNSLDEALKQGVTPADLEPFSRGRSGLVSHYSGTCTNMSARFDVEGRTRQPYLQAVYVLWSSWEAMVADFESHGVTVH